MYWRGSGNPLQYSCLENSMDRGAWWGIVHGVARVRHELVTFTLTHIHTHTHTYTHTYIVFICCYLVTKSCPTLCNPVDHNPPGYPWDSPGKNTRVGCHFLLQGVFPTHGSTHICIEKQVFYY